MFDWRLMAQRDREARARAAARPRRASGPPDAVFVVLMLTLAPLNAGAAPAVGDTTTVLLLGTGTPYPDPARHGPATAVTVGERVFLFDAGSGVMRQLKAAGLPISGVEAAFITHLHSDHTLGLPDLMLTSWVMRRQKPFPLIGPPGLAQMVDHIVAAWSEDIQIRTEGLEREVPEGYRVAVREVGPGVVYDSAGVRVRAIAVLHGSWPAYGYRIDTPDRSIVISGDTRPAETLLEAARGVDLLVHEAYLAARAVPEDRPGGEFWPQYLREVHTSGLELGALAARAKPGVLLITHFGGPPEKLREEIRRGGWSGPLIIGEDLGRY